MDGPATIDGSSELRNAHERLRDAYRQIDRDLDAARRLQQFFAHRPIPDISPLRLAIHHRSCGQPGGDCFNAFRIDANHVGMYLADTSGHGLSAALLTLCLERLLKTRALNPKEVLSRLNDTLLDLALSEVPFLSVVYVVIHVGTGTLQFARAGHPPLVYVSRDAAPEVWHAPGNLLGLSSVEVTPLTKSLQPGDRVLLLSDGVIGGADDTPAKMDRVLASAAAFQELPLEAFVDALAHDLLDQNASDDDVTLLALEWPG